MFGSFILELVPSIMSNLLNPDAIFSNNEMSLSDIEIYGFDYDYTLVFYSKHLHTLIFNAARDLLINEHRVRAQGSPLFLSRPVGMRRAAVSWPGLMPGT